MGLRVSAADRLRPEAGRMPTRTGPGRAGGHEWPQCAADHVRHGRAHGQCRAQTTALR